MVQRFFSLFLLTLSVNFSVNAQVVVATHNDTTFVVNCAKTFHVERKKSTEVPRGTITKVYAKTQKRRHEKN